LPRFAGAYEMRPYETKHITQPIFPWVGACNFGLGGAALALRAELNPAPTKSEQTKQTTQTEQTRQRFQIFPTEQTEQTEQTRQGPGKES